MDSMLSEPNYELLPQSDYDILFVNPAHHGPDYYTPIGVNLLKSLVEKVGFKAGLLDFQRKVIREGFPWPEGFLLAAEGELTKIRSKLFGFTVMNVGFPWAVELAALVKRLHPESIIVFGGPHATLLGHEILKLYPQVDIVARNEGEPGIVPLLRAIVNNDQKALQSCPNLLIRTSSGDILATRNATFLPDLDVLPMISVDSDLLGNVEIFSVEAGRGCPYYCSFCSSHAIWTRSPRFKSPRRLVDEAQVYVAKAPLRAEKLVISYEHDDFLSNRPLFRQFVSYKIESRADFRYAITTRINHLTKEVIDLLSQSGCISVFMGIETGSTNIQNSSSKHLDLEKIWQTLESLRAARIYVNTNFIIGFPDETYDDVVATFELILALGWRGCGINISMMCPEPGSAIHSATSPDQYRLLREGLYARELRRGGIEPDELDPVARYHLVTIHNRHYDILKMAALCESMQFLIADLPFLLFDLYNQLGSDVRSLIDVISNHVSANGIISLENIEQFISAACLRSYSKRSKEFVAYELAKSAVKHKKIPTARPESFQSDMPDAYYYALDEIADFRQRDVPTKGLDDD